MRKWWFAVSFVVICGAVAGCESGCREVHDAGELFVEIRGSGAVNVDFQESSAADVVCEGSGCVLTFELHATNTIDFVAIDRDEVFLQWEDGNPDEDDHAQCVVPNPHRNRTNTAVFSSFDVGMEEDRYMVCTAVFGPPLPRVEDPPETGFGDPSLDIKGAEAAHTPDGDIWVAVEMHGMWEPGVTLWSWFVSQQIKNPSGFVLADCTTQVHDAVPSTFCDVGDPANLEVRATAVGPVFIFKGGLRDATAFTTDSGTAPTSGSQISRDTVTGTIGAQQLLPPPPK